MGAALAGVPPPLPSAPRGAGRWEAAKRLPWQPPRPAACRCGKGRGYPTKGRGQQAGGVVIRRGRDHREGAGPLKRGVAARPSPRTNGEVAARLTSAAAAPAHGRAAGARGAERAAAGRQEGGREGAARRRRLSRSPAPAACRRPEARLGSVLPGSPLPAPVQQPLRQPKGKEPPPPPRGRAHHVAAAPADPPVPASHLRGAQVPAGKPAQAAARSR